MPAAGSLPFARFHHPLRGGHQRSGPRRGIFVSAVLAKLPAWKG